jgi:hypothetical protein
MAESHWKAQWIKSQANRIEAPPEALKTAHWIWLAPAGQIPWPAPLGTCLFQKEFVVPSELKSASLSLAADSHARLFINEQKVATTETWQRGITCDVLDFLKQGSNSLRIEAENVGDCAKIAGVICGLHITDSDNNQEDIVSDQSWHGESADSESELTVHQIAPWNEGPWGHHVYFNPQQHIGQPVFRKNFKIENTPSEAWVHISGVGQFQLQLNGQKVGDSIIDPPWSVYEKTRYYRSFDIADLLKQGTNEWQIIMGKGFHNSIGDRIVHHTHRWGEVMAILEAQLQYADGHTQIIGTDASWQVGHGPITHDTMLGGCDYDARHEQPHEWHPALETQTSATLRQAESPPMKTYNVLAPIKEIEEPEKGVFVYDFGQNLSAIPKVTLRGKAGQNLRLIPAEQRHGQTERSNNGHGTVDQAGVGSPNHYDYTLKGHDSETYQPPCTYGGFQYLQLEGAVPVGKPNPKGLPEVSELQSLHVRSSVASVGSFSCSKPLFNKIDDIIDRAVRSNLAHVLTDCPTREKLGWLEVAYLMGPSISRRYDLSRLYAKITRDIRDTQGEHGAIYTTAPSYATFDPNHRIGYTLEWGAAGIVVPWQLYRWYGDHRILAENYVMMKSFITYIQKTSNDLIPKPGLGDWFDYGHGHPRGASRFTPPELTACATFYRCTKILADSAKVLGYNEDAILYHNLAQDIHQRFNQEFYCGQGIYKNYGSPQTANAMALSLTLCPKSDQELTLQVLLDDLEKRDHQQTAGDVGFHYLIDTLSQYECHEMVYKMLNRRDEGSYGFSIDRGWTSLPEAWEAATKESMNHCMLGHAQQWLSHELLGIQQAEDSIAFEHIVIKPAIVSDITWARGYYECIRGRIVSEWSKRDKGLNIKIEIPTNARFSLHIPIQEHQNILIHQKSIDEYGGLQQSEPRHGVVVLTGGSGSYEINTI